VWQKKGGRQASVQRLFPIPTCVTGKRWGAQLKMREGETVLAETPVAWTYDTAYELRLRVRGTHIHAWLNGELCLEAHDSALTQVSLGPAEIGYAVG